MMSSMIVTKGNKLLSCRGTSLILGALVLLTAVVIAPGFVSPAMAGYTVDSFSVQHRIYEDGQDFNRVMFVIKDGSGNYVKKNLLKSATIKDPEGQVVTVSPSDLKFWTYSEWDGSYDGDNGVFFYGSAYTTSYYSGKLPGKLIAGTYLLSAKYATSTCRKDFIFNSEVGLPIIPISSFTYSVDGSGNLTAAWDVPMELCKKQPALQTSVRGWVDVYQDDTWKGELYVRIPTHMGRLFVPGFILDQVKKKGNKYRFGIHLRTNDNNNRAYSNSTSISLSPSTHEVMAGGHEDSGGGEM